MTTIQLRFPAVPAIRLLLVVFVVVFVVLCMAGLGLGPAFGQEPPAKTQTVVYWDLGLQFDVPADWTIQFVQGEILAAPPGYVKGQTITEGLLAIHIVDPVRDLALLKDTPYDVIAETLVTSGGTEVEIVGRGTTELAGVPSGYVNVSDLTNKLSGQAIGFRMPDGRMGVWVTFAPDDKWADFGVTASEILNTARLVRPSLYEVPALAQTVARFAPGRFNFGLPGGWEAFQINDTGSAYHDATLVAYADSSGFLNGPQLVVMAGPLETSVSLQTAVGALIGADTSDPAQTLQIGKPNATRIEAVQYALTDSATGQIVFFIGFASGETLNVLRWSTPGALVGVSLPVLDSILDSIQLDR